MGRGGSVLDELTKGSAIGNTATEIEHADALSNRKVSVGDLIRYGNEVRQVETLVSNKKYNIVSTFGSEISASSTLYIQNGMAYDITFEAGCRSHEDCRYNGVDESDSDGPAQKVLYEGGDNNAAYCHNGGTCMCTDGFYGPG